jgi:aryl-alcohol dehydrogenase-like predicted oxidoreductase
MDTTFRVPQRPLGNTGLQVSILGLGCGHIGGDAEGGERQIEALLHEALDHGINLLDTAPSYGRSEERIGRLLGSRRHEIVLSTKGGYGVPGVPDWTAAALTQGIDLALQRLRRERLEIFHLHSCPRELLLRDDLLDALRRAQAAGKIGVAAYSGENDALTHAVLCGAFGCVQTSVNLCDQRSLHFQVPTAAARGIGVIGKRPLANMAWTYAARPSGQYAEVYWERFQALRPHLAALPALPDATDELDVALRFAAYAPGVSSVIAGTHSIAHLQRNLRALARGPLPPAQHSAVQAAFQAVGAGWDGQI